ncbi:MAG: ATP-binding cassette domain-containing protein [Planctomycetota bacterium]|nr:ATP-binding cassette domain-containing protein [Planctomycetota bacterium]
MQGTLTFLRSLATAAGRPAPDPDWLSARLVPSGADSPTGEEPNVWIARLEAVCADLGLGMTVVRPRLDEALAMTAARRPVVLLLRNGDATEVCTVTDEGGATVTVHHLEGDEHRTWTGTRSEVESEVLGSGAQVEAAFQVASLGNPGDDDRPALEGRPLRRLWHILTPDRTEVGIVVGFALGLGILTLATPIAVQSLVNFVAFGGLMQPLLVVGLLLLFFLAFAGAIRVFKFYVVEVLQRRLFVRVVTDLSARLPRVRLDAYDRGSGPELVNRFFDVMTIQKAGSALLIDGLDSVLQAGIGLLVLGFYHPYLLVFDVLLILSIAFILFGLGRGAVATARKESSAKYQVVGALEELARAPITYKLAGAPEFARARMAELTAGYISARRKHYSVVFRQLVGAVTLHAVAATSLLGIGGLLVIEGQLTLGQLVAAELIVSVALVSFVKFGKQLEAFYDLLAGVDKLGLLLDLPTEDDLGDSHLPKTPGAALRLQGVSYRYPSSGRGVGRIDVRIEPGERIAVLGDRSSGKTTLAELLGGLREPDEGVVCMDDQDLREIARVSVRTQLDLVTGFEIVEGSILDNVRLGRADVTTQEIRDALDRLGVLSEFAALPDGLRTRLLQDGAPLSRTSALLLTLARATVGAPRAIVVDGTLDELGPGPRARALEALTASDAPWTLVLFTASPELAAQVGRTIELDAGNAAVEVSR